jgi:hypothetical protein
VAQHRTEIASRTLYGDTRSANLFLARFGPDWPVYFDGRHAEIYPPAIFRIAAKTRYDVATFEQEAAKYGIGLVCFALTDLKEDRSPLAVALGQTNTWRLVYLDDCAALFAANSRSNAPLVSRYGLVEAPTNALWQRRVFGEWLERQGRKNLMALDEPANRSLADGVVARLAVNAMQANGLWAPERELAALRLCRLAKFMDHLGWSVVADDIYQQTMRWPGDFRLTMPRAIRQARKVSLTVADPVLRQELRRRMQQRAEALQGVDPGNAQAAQALNELRP